MALTGGAGIPGISKGIPLQKLSKGIPGRGLRTVSRVQKGQLGQFSTIPRTGLHAGSLQPLPQAAAAGAAPQAPQAPQGPSPLDATYYANVAGFNARTGNSIAGLNQANAYRDTDLQAALQKLAVAEPQNELKLEQSANNRGGLYSSVYQQGAGNLASQYAQQQAALQQQHDRANAAALSQIGQDRQAMNDYAIQQALAAAGRASASAARDQSLGMGLPSGAAPVASQAAPSASQAPQSPRAQLAASIARRPVVQLRVPPQRLSKGIPLRGRITKGLR